MTDKHSQPNHPADFLQSLKLSLSICFMDHEAFIQKLYPLLLIIFISILTSLGSTHPS